MDWIKLKQKAIVFTGKYCYVLFILLIGVGLMLIPFSTDKKEDNVQKMQVEETLPSVAERLERILSEVKGAGKVSVMLTVEAGEKIQYQTDINQSGENSNREDTVIITDEDRTQSGLIQQIHSETYRGAIVVCQGADSPTVRLAIIEAVSRVTGLDSTQISILKMK